MYLIGTESFVSCIAMMFGWLFAASSRKSCLRGRTSWIFQEIIFRDLGFLLLTCIYIKFVVLADFEFPISPGIIDLLVYETDFIADSSCGLVNVAPHLAGDDVETVLAA